MSGQSIEVPYRSRSNISHFAYVVRREMKLPDGEFPIIEFLELAMPRIDPDFVFGVRSKAEMGGNHGLTIPAERAVYLRADVYGGAVKGNPRDRFTAAHELGHYLLHLDVPVKYHKAYGRKRLKHEVDSESQANLFAAALLIPERRFVKCRSLNEAADKYGVSTATARFLNRILARERKMKALN